MKKRIAIILPYPLGIAPSQRFRIEQYKSYLEEEFDLRFFFFWSRAALNILYSKGNFGKKLLYLILGFLKRFSHLFSAISADTIYIHREITPVGPPIFEWLLAKIFRKRIVYDFDDAIWLPNTSDVNTIARKLKWHGKVKHICRWSSIVTVGNHWLGEFAQHYAKDVRYIPTTIDHRTLGGEALKKKNLIVWTGSHSTLKYLKSLEKVFEKLKARGNTFQFRYIADKSFEEIGEEVDIPNIEFVRWTTETEVKSLQEASIGVMPLEDTDWEKGKCGFKLLQYMAQKIACVASDVGANKYILRGGNGKLVTTEEEWVMAIEWLLREGEKSVAMGELGYKLLEEEFTDKSCAIKYFNLF